MFTHDLHVEEPTEESILRRISYIGFVFEHFGHEFVSGIKLLKRRHTADIVLARVGLHAFFQTEENRGIARIGRLKVNDAVMIQNRGSHRLVIFELNNNVAGVCVLPTKPIFFHVLKQIKDAILNPFACAGPIPGQIIQKYLLIDSRRQMRADLALDNEHRLFVAWYASPGLKLYLADIFGR